MRNAAALPWQSEQAGLLTLPGTSRTVWWTGKVAIGLRYERQPARQTSRSEEWIQQLLLQAQARVQARAAAA